ncbi:peptidase M20 domain-containing protein 2 [Tachysurus ichikawai]
MNEKLQALKQLVCFYIDEAKDKLHLLGDSIWRHPEVACEERQAHETKLWSASSPRRKGHTCGHDLIAESGAAAALGLKVTLLGTPAEEAEGKKVDLLQEGVFEDLDVVFMAHPSQEDATYIPDVAEHDLVVKYHGHASHASAYPWEGVNAPDAAVMAYTNISVLRQQLRPDWRVHGIIRHGGVKPNIIPDYTAALATGCKVELIFARNKFYEILRNHTLESLYEENGKSLGMKFITVETSSGSTDFGNVTHAVPGIHPYFYIGSEALNHTTEYTAASGPDEAQFYIHSVLPKLWP